MNLPTFDFEAHLARQAAFSARTFGPGARTEGICDHIRKELLEVAAAPDDLKEWIDVAILALDGAWRSGATPGQIIGALVAKQSKNEGRAWPDWRTADPTKAIEHVRSGESKQADTNGKPQPIVGRLMDQISALPVLWGLNEPGALLRNSDVLRVLAAAGREQAAIAATPVQTAMTLDQIMDEAAKHKRALVPLHVTRAMQEIMDDDGWQWGDVLGAAEAITDQQYAEILAGPGAPMLPVALPDGWKLVPAEPNDAMQAAGAQAVRIDTTVVNKIWTGNAVFRAMIAAAPTAPAPQSGTTQAAMDVLAERRRQVDGEGMTNDADDSYTHAELPFAAASYILNGRNDEAPAIWPWSKAWWKPRGNRANYVRAGALIVAEIERLDRAAAAEAVKS